MADAPPKTNRAVALAKTVAKFGAAWGVVAVVAALDRHSNVWWRMDNWVQDAIARVFSGFPAITDVVDSLYHNTLGMTAWAYFVTLFLSTGIASLGFATRLVARSRVRAGHADFLDRVRAWVSSHPKGERLLYAAPGALWALLDVMRWGGWEYRNLARVITVVTPGFLIAAAGMYLVARQGMRALLAPTIDGELAASTMTIGADEIVFDAVAVTREAKVMVGSVAALSVAVTALIASRPIISLFHDRWPFYLMASYVVVAATTAIAFQKASRVAVGVDGVHVRGTSRAKFFAYRDLDEARANGGDIELVRRGRVLLRLQLHGEDAMRRDAVLARITEHIARVKEGRGAMAAQMVASSTKEALARIAHGGADYRMAAMTREQLWALVEGPEIEASARKAAAVALATSNDGSERARLRVAAEHCAEPQVRVALEEIARGDDVANEAPRARGVAL
jgi:hypothetical protein